MKLIIEDPLSPTWTREVVKEPKHPDHNFGCDCEECIEYYEWLDYYLNTLKGN